MSVQDDFQKPYSGTCHCGKFRYAFASAPFEDGARAVDQCNCGFCVKKGALWLSIPEGQLKLASGSFEELTLYEFHKKVFKHYFCPVCGVQCFLKDTRPDQNEVKFEVNIRTMDGIGLDKLSVRLYDGKNLL